MLVINYTVSYRSVPKILKILRPHAEFLEKIKIPHFTTVIRWVCRIGYYLLTRSNKKVCSTNKPWICIADHTIQVGTNKAFVVIGVPSKVMNSGKAVQLKDVVALAISVKKSWTGNEVSKVIKKVFNRNGLPSQIVIDGAHNLNNGIRQAIEEMEGNCHITYDITHLLANLMKKKYNCSVRFLEMLEKLSFTSKQITQTEIGYLLPPKLREKSRFLNLPNLANWLGKILDIQKSDTLTSKERRQIKKYFGWIWKPEWESYIRELYGEITTIKDIQKILKNTGINDFSYKKACSKLSKIDDDKFASNIMAALSVELEYKNKIGFPLLLTSDIIESLFGKYKTIAKPHRLSEINKSVLSIPLICEDLKQSLVDKAFFKATVNDVDKWKRNNIPVTLLSRKKIVLGCKKNSVDASIYSKVLKNDSIFKYSGQKIGVI